MSRTHTSVGIAIPNAPTGTEAPNDATNTPPPHRNGLIPVYEEITPPSSPENIREVAES